MSARPNYRSISSNRFDSPQFQRLSPDARLALLALELGPQAGPGRIFPYYPELLARRTGLDINRIQAAVKELRDSGWIICDDLNSLLWVKDALRDDPAFDITALPNHRKAVEKWLQGLPQCRLVARFRRHYGLSKPTDSLASSPGQGAGIRKNKTEEKTEDNTEDNTETRSSPKFLCHHMSTPSTPSASLVAQEAVASQGDVVDSPEAFIELYNRARCPEWAEVQHLVDVRRENIAQWLKEYPSRSFWESVFDEAHRSRFLRGLVPPAKNGRPFKGHLEWLLGVKDGVPNFVKVAKGKYRDSRRSQGGTPTPERPDVMSRGLPIWRPDDDK